MTASQHMRLSAGVVITRNGEKDRNFLLLRAFNYWDFPKGMVEQDESPFDAAKREVAEETGITELSFHWGEEFFETPPYNRGKIARYYLAETTQAEVQLLPNPETGRPEHIEYRWLNFEQALDLVSPRVHQVMHWAAARL